MNKALIPKKSLAILSFLLLVSQVGFSNCPFTFNFFGSGNAPAPGDSATLQTCSFIGEAVTANGVVAGDEYTVDITYSSAPPPAIIPFVVVYDDGFNPIASGTNPVSFIAPASGTYYTIAFLDDLCTDFDPNFGCNSTKWLNTTSTELPVELSAFYGKATGKYNTLHWETNAELGNDYFNLLRSFDGENFETIGTIDGAGFSQEVNKYEFVDDVGTSRLTYYQLKQVDFDGRFEVSEIIAIDRTDEQNEFISVFPNPSFDIITVEINGTKSRNAQLTVTNTNAVLMRQEYFNTEGIQKFSLDLSRYEPGLYFLRYQDAVSEQTVKIVKN